MIEDGRSRPSGEFCDPVLYLSEQNSSLELTEPVAPVATLMSPRAPADVRAFIVPESEVRGLSGRRLDDLVMATNEIATNAYAHALIDRVRLWREDHRVVCEVSDLGSGLDDPLAGYRPLEPDQIGGYGLWLARQLTDLAEIRARTTGTTFRLHVRLG